MEMKSGDMFRVTGYDIYARLSKWDGGEVLVLNNNSSHFLLAVRPGDADDEAMFVSSRRYGADDGPESPLTQYRAILLDAINEAA